MIRSRVCRLFLAFGLALAVLAPAGSVRAATPAEIDNAIKRGQAFLLSKQSVPGRWESSATRDGQDHFWQSMQGATWGGYTAVATYALLASGMSPQHPDLAAAIRFLKTADIVGPYALSARTLVWTYLPANAETRALFKKDLGLLMSGLNTHGRAAGLWDYADLGPAGDYIDHSVSQFGVLAVWSCVQGGLTINSKLWQTFDDVWKAHQNVDGGWSYEGAGDSGGSTPSMTAAGIATLFITREHIPDDNALNCRGVYSSEAIDRGLLWINENFHSIVNNNYVWYGIERIGAASGRKHFGGRDWYAIGSQEVVSRQRDDGSWGTSNYPGMDPVSDTAFALLFLSRGRAPVLVNKLNHGPIERAAGVQAPPPAGGGPRAPGSVAPVPASTPTSAPTTTTAPATAPTTVPISDWNQRPGDVSVMTRWVGRQNERYAHWQVLDLGASERDLMEAPVLYISGSNALVIDDKGVEKLRRYVEDGGLILGNADCGRREFADSFRALGKRMFPSYRFRELPNAHPILSGQGFRADRWKERISLEGLSNGSRELMLLIPTADAGRAWQESAVRTHEPLFQLASNIFLYANDKRMDRLKGQTHLVFDRGTAPQRRVGIARIVTDGNWNPEPGGWRRLAAVMKNDYSLGLSTEQVKLGTGKLSASNTPVAHLTGTDTFKLDPAQREELKRFVEIGGTLVIDATGGSTAFADAAEAELLEIFGDEAALELKTVLPSDHPVYKAGGTIGKIGYRRTAMQKVVGELKGPRLRGITFNNRLGVILSREDLSTGMVGHDVDGVLGYDPASATALMRNVVLYGTGLGKVLARPAQTVPGGTGLE